jgi:hypothetical protein
MFAGGWRSVDPLECIYERLESMDSATAEM